MRLATLALVASSCFVGSPAEAHRSAPPPRQLRGIAVLKEAFHLERQRSLRVGHLQGPGGAVVDGLLVGVLAKVGWMVPTVAPGLILTALPLLTPTSSYLGWRWLEQNGPSQNRVDVVVMGDGYMLEHQSAFDEAFKREYDKLP